MAQHKYPSKRGNKRRAAEVVVGSGVIHKIIDTMTGWQRHQWSRFCGNNTDRRRDTVIAERYADAMTLELRRAVGA